MPTCDGVDDIVALVGQIDANPAVLVNLNGPELFYSDWQAPPPPNDGPIYLASSHAGRTIELNVNVQPQVNADDVAAVLQPLQRYVSRGNVWLMFQKAGAFKPVFFKLRKSDVTSITEWFAYPKSRTIHLSLNADPFAYGLKVTGSFTITNDPSAASNPMMAAFPEIEGDVLTPLWCTFPTEQGRHKIKWASAAYLRLNETRVAWDSYDRVNSPTTMGAADSGQTWQVYSGGAVAGIIDNSAYFSTDVSGYAAAVIETGYANGWVEETLTTGLPTTDFFGILFRSSDTANGFFAGEEHLFRRLGGVTANLGAYSEPFVDGDRMRITFDGSAIKVYRQEAAAGDWTEVLSVTDTNFLTNTKHGHWAFGTSGDQARFNDFAAGPGAPDTPYYKLLTTETIKSPAPSGWTIADQADTGTIGGATKRQLTRTSTSVGDSFLVPTQSDLAIWSDLPVADYRVFVRIVSGDEGWRLLFFNGPTIEQGNNPIEAADAATWTTLGPTASATGHRDWLDLGVAAMPGGAPPADTMFNLDQLPSESLWGLGVEAADLGNLGLDAIMLVPAGSTDVLTRHGSVAFSNDWQGKQVVLDGLNSRRYAVGEYDDNPGTDLVLPPLDMSGALPVVVPNAENRLFFLADTAYYNTNRVSDSKATTTLIEWLYHPRYLNDRPEAS